MAPAIVLLCAAALLRGYKVHQLPKFGATLLIVGTVFVGTHVAYRSINWWAYGKFIGVDFLEPNYQRALRAIHSVRSGEVKRYISATRKTQELIAAISPTFASITDYFDAQSTKAGWGQFTCRQYPAACGEIATGWFIFALRDAASMKGHYASPAAASRFFGKMADEIDAACSKGTLECHPQLGAEMPPLMMAEVIGDMPRAYLDEASMLLFRNPSRQINGSSTNEEELAKFLFFLNYPRYERPPYTELVSYTLSGWYFRGTTDWMSVGVNLSNGDAASVSVSRDLSPDIAAGFKAPEATRQRFTLRTHCIDDCIVHVKGIDGAEAKKKLGEFRPGGVSLAVGDGRFHVDMVRVYSDPAAVRQLSDVVAELFRLFVLRSYEYLFLPVLALGFIAFVCATLRYWREIPWNVCYVLALVSWILVFMRVTVLVAMDITTATTVINPFYGAPAFYHLVCAVVLSIASWVQLFKSRVEGSGPIATDEAR